LTFPLFVTIALGCYFANFCK